MAIPSNQLDDVEHLIAQSEALIPFARIIYRLDRLLAPPSVPMLLHGLRRLRRLQEVLSWPLPVIDELTQKDLDRLILEMAAVPGMQVEPMDPTGLQVAYPVWASLAEHEPQPDAYSCLHGLLVLVSGCRPRKTLIQNLASAIRGAGRTQTGADESLKIILEEVPYTSEPAEFFALLVDLRYRIARAKPALHKILINRIPALLGWAVPEDHPDPEGLDWVPPTPVPLPPGAPVEPWEPEEEIQPPDEYLPAAVDISRPIGSLRSALISLRQRIDGGNALLVPEHISSLRREEARHLADWLHQYICQANADIDSRMLTGAAILATMLATGRTGPRAAAILETAVTSKPAVGRPALDLNTEQLVQPVLVPESAYSADDESGQHLLKTSQTMRLPLPERYLNIVKQWKKLVSIRPLAHWKSIYPVLEKIRGQTNLDYTEGRIRHTLSCHACEVSSDPVQSIWITGNDARHSLAPTHYCVLDHSGLENTYARAVWPIFQGDEIPPRSLAKGLVGAQTCPKDDFIRDGLKKLAGRVHNPTRQRGSAKSLAELHNGVVDHITVLLVVLTGHRPNNAIHRLQRWDFDLQLGVAVYRDKRSDPAHFYCPVALGTILTEQLVVYEHHLAALAGALHEQGAPQNTLGRVEQALSGEAPWFFHLDESLQATMPSFEAWGQLFSACFPGVPPNVGRSYLARKLRSEAGSRPEFAYLQLSHYAIIGYPYIADGPTAIAEMARSLGPVIDKVAKSSLGRMRKVKGLYQGSRTPKPLQLSAPCIGIRDWDAERREAEQAAIAHKQRLREQRRMRANELRPEAEARFFRRMSRIHPEFSAALKTHFQDKRLPEASRTYGLKPEDIELLLAESSSDRSDKNEDLPAAEVIALRNYTHYALSRARKSRYYRGPLPRAEIRLPSRFRTEFHPNMLAAAETMRRLRREFYRSAPRELPEEAAADGVTEEEWRCAYLAAVLVLFGGVAHLSRLIGLLSPGCEVARHPRSDDAVLVQYSTEPPHVWALWRTAAVAYLQLTEGLPKATPEKNRISRALEHVLPKELQRHGEADLLNCFLDTARTAELTDLSGMARASIHPETGSWSLPLRRQVAWLSNADDQSTPPEGIARSSSESKSSRMPKAHEIKEVYNRILPLIPRANRDVVDEEGNVTIPHEQHRRYRNQVVESVRDVIAAPDVPELAAAFGEWLCQMFRQKKSEGVYTLAESTIYNYFTTVGSGFLNVLPERMTMDLDDDEYIDLYAALLERKPEKSRKTTARELRNFHSLLTRRYSAPELDWSELADYLVDVPGRVDAQAVLSSEAEHALHTLRDWAFGESANGQTNRRLLRQSYIVLLLLILTGCRMSEITGLQHRDIYQTFERLYIRIRPNYGRGTKSDAAKRILDVTDVISNEEMSLLLRWKEAEKRRMGKRWRMTTRLLLDIDTDRPVDRDLLRTYTQSALRNSSQWLLISHHIRHGLGGRIQIDFGLFQMSVIQGVRMDAPLQYDPQDHRSILLPRDTTRYRVLIGHAANCTVNRSYGHCPWVYLHYPVLDWHSSLDSVSIAAATGCSYVNHRRQKSQYGKKLWSELLDNYLEPIIPIMVIKRKVAEPPTMPFSGLPATVQYLIATAPAVTDPKKGAYEEDYEAYGLGISQVNKLLRAAEEIARSTGIAFFSQHSTLGHARSSMVPQRTRYSDHAWLLLRCLESDQSTVEMVTTAFVAAVKRAKREEIILPRQQAYDLRELVKRYCPVLQLNITEQQAGYRCDLIGPDDHHLNHWLSWLLALIAVHISAS